MANNPFPHMAGTWAPPPLPPPLLPVPNMNAPPPPFLQPHLLMANPLHLMAAPNLNALPQFGPPFGPPPLITPQQQRLDRILAKKAARDADPFDAIQHIQKFARKRLSDESTERPDCEILQRVQTLPQELQDHVLHFLTVGSLEGGGKSGVVRIDKYYKPPIGLLLDRHHRNAFAKAYYGGNMVFEFVTGVTYPNLEAEEFTSSFERFRTNWPANHRKTLKSTTNIPQRWLKSLTFQHMNMIMTTQVALQYRYLEDYALTRNSAPPEFLHAHMMDFLAKWKKELCEVLPSIEISPEAVVGYVGRDCLLTKDTKLVLNENDSYDEFWAKFTNLRIRDTECENEAAGREKHDGIGGLMVSRSFDELSDVEPEASQEPEEVLGLRKRHLSFLKRLSAVW